MAVRRDTKESTATREKFVGFFTEEEFQAIEEVTNCKFIGQSAEGLTFKDNATGLFTVIKVVTKAPDFDGEAEVAELKEKKAIQKTKESKKNGPVVIIKEKA